MDFKLKWSESDTIVLVSVSVVPLSYATHFHNKIFVCLQNMNASFN